MFQILVIGFSSEEMSCYHLCRQLYCQQMQWCFFGFSFGPTLIPVIFSFSASIVYNIMESGQPCLTPFSAGKDWDMFLLTLICASMLLHIASIIDIIVGPYPIECLFLVKHYHACFNSFMLAKDIMSLFSCRFSIIVLPLIAVVCSVLIISVSEFCKRLGDEMGCQLVISCILRFL